MIFGIGMGGEWGVGASLAMEKAPTKLRGVLSGLLQEGYATGNLLAAVGVLLRVPALGMAADVLHRRTAGAARDLRAHAREGVGGVGAHATSRLQGSTARRSSSHWRLFLYLTLLMA